MGAALGAPHEAATALDVASLGTGIGAFTAEGGATSNATRRDEMMARGWRQTVDDPCQKLQWVLMRRE